MGSPRKYLGVDQGTGARQLDFIKYFPFIQLESTINVADFQPKQKANQLGPAPAIYFADYRIPAIQPIAANDIVLFHQGK